MADSLEPLAVSRTTDPSSQSTVGWHHHSCVARPVKSNYTPRQNLAPRPQTRGARPSAGSGMRYSYCTRWSGTALPHRSDGAKDMKVANSRRVLLGRKAAGSATKAAGNGPPFVEKAAEEGARIVEKAAGDGAPVVENSPPLPLESFLPETFLLGLGSDRSALHALLTVRKGNCSRT